MYISTDPGLSLSVSVAGVFLKRGYGQKHWGEVVVMSEHEKSDKRCKICTRFGPFKNFVRSKALAMELARGSTPWWSP